MVIAGRIMWRTCSQFQRQASEPPGPAPVGGSQPSCGGEDDDQHHAEPIVRHRYADDRDGRGELVDPGVAKIAGDKSEERAEHKADEVASDASISVFETAFETSVITGRLVRIDVPRSPVIARPSHLMNCSR